MPPDTANIETRLDNLPPELRAQAAELIESVLDFAEAMLQQGAELLQSSLLLLDVHQD